MLRKLLSMQIGSGHYSNVMSYGRDEGMALKSAPAGNVQAALELANEVEALIQLRQEGLVAAGVVPGVHSCGYDARVRPHASMHSCTCMHASWGFLGFVCAC